MSSVYIQVLINKLKILIVSFTKISFCFLKCVKPLESCGYFYASVYFTITGTTTSWPLLMWHGLGCELGIRLQKRRWERKANFWQFCVFVPELRESSRWLHSVQVCCGVWLCLWLCHWCCYPPSQQPTGEVSLFSQPSLQPRDTLHFSEALIYINTSGKMMQTLSHRTQMLT